MKIDTITIVGGCGHVGLPLGLALASRGFRVHLLDIDQKGIDKVNRGELPFIEIDGEGHLRTALAEKKLSATADRQVLSESQAVVFVTGTPVDEHLNPRVQDVMKVISSYAEYLSGKLIILRSTLYPGVVEMIDQVLIDRHGKSLLAFCPERIVQGNGIREIFHLPQIVSATSKEAENLAEDVFSKIAPKVLKMTPMEAALTKLINNCWRYMEFAIANQFYMMVESKGLDFWRIMQGVKEDYPRAAHYPRPGLAAGPCLFKDTMQLAAFHDQQFTLGHTGMVINEGLPAFLVGQLETKMKSYLRGKKIALLGMTFKANNDDTRESLSFKVKKLLEMQMATVLPTDPFLPHLCSLEEALENADGVIIGTPHKEYLNLKIDKPVVDCWGIYARTDLSTSPFTEKK